MNVCEICKTENLENYHFCSNCGNSLIQKKYITPEFVKTINQNTFIEDIILVFKIFLHNLLGWFFLFGLIYLINFIPFFGKPTKFLFAGFFIILYSFFCLRKTISNKKITLKDFSLFLNKKYLNYFILIIIQIVFYVILSITSITIFILLYSVFAKDFSISSDPFLLLLNSLPYFFISIGIFIIFNMFLSFIIQIASIDVIMKKNSSFFSIKKVFKLLNKKITPITVYYLKLTAFFIPIFIFILLFSLLYLNISLNIPINIFISIDTLKEFFAKKFELINFSNSYSDFDDLIYSFSKFISKIGFLIFLINIMISPIYNLFNTIAYFKFFYSEE